MYALQWERANQKRNSILTRRLYTKLIRFTILAFASFLQQYPIWKEWLKYQRARIRDRDNLGQDRHFLESDSEGEASSASKHHE